jgi:hypothetical protein
MSTHRRQHQGGVSALISDVWICAAGKQPGYKTREAKSSSQRQHGGTIWKLQVVLGKVDAVVHIQDVKDLQEGVLDSRLV